MKYRVSIPDSPDHIALMCMEGFESSPNRQPYKALFVGDADGSGAVTLELDHEMVEFLTHISPRADGYVSQMVDGSPVLYLGDEGFGLDPVPDPSPMDKPHWRIELASDAHTLFFHSEVKLSELEHPVYVHFELNNGKLFYIPWTSVERVIFFPEGIGGACIEHG